MLSADSQQLYPGGTGSIFIKISYRMSSPSPCVKPVNESTLQACHSGVLGEGTFTEVNTGPGTSISVSVAEEQNRLSEFRRGNGL